MIYSKSTHKQAQKVDVMYFSNSTVIQNKSHMWSKESLEAFHKSYILKNLYAYKEVEELWYQIFNKAEERLTKENGYIVYYVNNQLVDVERYIDIQTKIEEYLKSGTIITIHPINYKNTEDYLEENRKCYKRNKQQFDKCIDNEEEENIEEIIYFD